MSSLRLMPQTPSRSVAVVFRLLGRLLVVGLFWARRPGASRGEAASGVCSCLAAGCVIAAVLHHQPINSAELNRRFEAVMLLVIGALILVLS
jgi:hypothetical protein